MTSRGYCSVLVVVTLLPPPAAAGFELPSGPGVARAVWPRLDLERLKQSVWAAKSDRDWVVAAPAATTSRRRQDLSGLGREAAHWAFAMYELTDAGRELWPALSAAARHGNVDLSASRRSIEKAKALERDLHATVWLHHDLESQHTVLTAPAVYT